MTLDALVARQSLHLTIKSLICCILFYSVYYLKCQKNDIFKLIIQLISSPTPQNNHFILMRALWNKMILSGFILVQDKCECETWNVILKRWNNWKFVRLCLIERLQLISCQLIFLHLQPERISTQTCINIFGVYFEWNPADKTSTTDQWLTALQDKNPLTLLQLHVWLRRQVTDCINSHISAG